LIDGEEGEVYDRGLCSLLKMGRGEKSGGEEMIPIDQFHLRIKYYAITYTY